MHLLELAKYRFAMRPYYCCQSQSQREPTSTCSPVLHPHGLSGNIYPLNLDVVDNTQSYIPTGESSEDTDSMDLLPPSTHRPTGRPKKRRIRGAAEREGRDKWAFRCSHCKQAGHSVRRCKQPI